MSTKASKGCFAVALSAATVVGFTTAKASMALEAVSTTDLMEWVLVDVTDGTFAVVEGLCERPAAIGTTVGVKVVKRWVMAEVAAGKEFMESFLLGNLTLGDLEVVVDTGLVDIGVRLTVFGVEVRLGLERETMLCIIVLRTRSMLKMRVRSIAILEARANMNMSGTFKKDAGV